MSSSASLSLCMIVKNEEACIERCLNSVKDIVDEIIIVDTGSTDHTIDICRSYGARMYSFAWNGSFSDARNIGLQHATGDWILILDADEELETQDIPKLRLALTNKNYDILSIRLLNYYGPSADLDKVTELAHLRLFRNHMGFQYENTIHELLNISDVVHDNKRIGYLDVKIYHYGYLDEVVANKNKSSRNIHILQDALEKKDDPWNHFYLAAEYYRLQQYSEALKQLNRSVVKFMLKGYIAPSIVYKLKYSILTDMGLWEETSRGIEKALLLYPDYVDLWFYKGIALYQKNCYEEALDTFEKCLELGDFNPDYYIVKGVGSFQAWYYKGLCLEALNKPEEACLACCKALLLSFQFQPALDFIARIVQHHEIPFQNLIEEHFDVNDGVTLLQQLSSVTLDLK